MDKKKKPDKPGEMPAPEKIPESPPVVQPEYPGVPEESPGDFPEEEPLQPEPDEVPPPGDFSDPEIFIRGSGVSRLF